MSATVRKSRAEAHTEAQRDRILCAARQCFIDSGFHAASMASIAETAGISAGLIYRYFENKNAIILAIIAHHLAEIQADIRKLQAASAVVENHIVGRFQSWQRQECLTLNPGLLLEIVALASRDPQVAEALCAADQRIRVELSAWLLRAWRNAGCELAESEALERVFVLQCFIEGLVIRSIKQPESDLALLQQSLRPLLAWLLPGDLEPPAAEADAP
ncbi:MAG: TetR/AcrR family transcriptional regulator [Candidatus Contendobacter sp.]